METPGSTLARLLDHPVTGVLEPVGAGWVAASVVDDPTRIRVAWVDLPEGPVRARVACPPGVPSRWRPVVACEVTFLVGGGPVDRVLAVRADPGVRAVRPVLAAEDPAEAHPLDPAGVGVLRLPLGVALLGVDALDAGGEPVGRLDRVGISELRTSGGSVSGRMGATHGMAAGFGDGRAVTDLAAAAFAAGFTPRLPGWLPDGLAGGAPWLEPEAAYPAAPPAVVLAWGDADHRLVLVRQAPAPLANPDPVGAGASVVDVGGHPAVLRGRGRFQTVVWETPDRAFGVLVRGMDDAAEVALRVARSIPAAPPSPGA